MTTNTNAASVAADLIREMQENVAKYGSENTTTYLMVQAINELLRLNRALVEVRRVLHAENERQGSPINDTIWRGPGETLFDFIDAAIGGEQIDALASPGAVAVPEAPHLTGDAKLAHDQCCAVVHLANALAEVYQANALILAAGQGPVEIIGQASAEVMEVVGDILNSTDAMDEDDLWLDPIYDAAQERWPVVRAVAAPAPQPETLRGLQNYYEQKAATYRSHASDLEHGRGKAPKP